MFPIHLSAPMLTSTEIVYLAALVPTLPLQDVFPIAKEIGIALLSTLSQVLVRGVKKDMNSVISAKFV